MKSIIARAVVPALLLACVLAWLVPAVRTPGMHVALFALFALALWQYVHRHGMLTKTLPQIYQAHRQRAIPALSLELVVVFAAAVTDTVWRIMW